MKRLLEEYKGNKEVLEEIENIKGHNIDHRNFQPGYYKKEFINAYGFEAVDKARCNYQKKLLKYGIENNKIEEVKLCLLYDFNDKLINDLELNELKKICELKEFKNIFRNYIREIDLVKKVLNNEKYINNLKKLATKFELNHIPDMVTDEYFMDNIDLSYITKLIPIGTFNEIYKNCKYLRCNDKDIYNNYIFNKDKYSFPLDEKTFYDKRLHEFKLRCNYMNIYDLRDAVCEAFFNRRYDRTVELLKDSKDFIDVSKYEFIIDCDKKILKENLENLKYENNIADKILSQTKVLAKKDICKNLYVRKDSDIVKLKGEDFSCLVHKIKGFGDTRIATELYRDPSTWTKYKDNESYISTSAINNNFSGIVDGDGYILGFDNINYKDILAMGPKDILTDKFMANNDYDNLLTRYSSLDTLINNTDTMYNEVVLKRYNESTSIMPDFIFTKDKITSKDKEVSKYFNIPIIEMETKYYADILMSKFKYCISMKEYKNAKRMLLAVINSFYESNYVIETYFNNLEIDILNITKDYNNLNQHELKELLELVRCYNEVAKILKEYRYINTKLNTRDVEININKLIKF